MKRFVNLQSDAKVIRSTAIPQGRTLEHIQASGILAEDEHRVKSYIKVKKIIDEYHKLIIADVLGILQLNLGNDGKKDSLSEFFEFYHFGTNDPIRATTLSVIMSNLRKQVIDQFKKDIRYINLFTRELITKDLIDFVADSEEISLINEFKQFTTYLTGYHENRKNMYAVEEKSTSIAHRIINVNLPLFIDNMKSFDIIKETPIANDFEKLQEELCAEFGNIMTLSEVFALQNYTHTLTQPQIDNYNAIIAGKTLDGGVKIKGLNEYINLYNQKEKSVKLPKLKLLKKQILSDRVAISFLPEKFESANELLKAVKQYYGYLNNNILKSNLNDIFKNISTYDLNGIFIANDDTLTDVAKRHFGDWGIVSRAMDLNFENTQPRRPRETYERYAARKEKYLKSIKSISIEAINNAVKTLCDFPIEQYFEAFGAVDNENMQKANYIARIKAAYTDIADILNAEENEENILKKNVDKIKTFLDEIQNLKQFLKSLLGTQDEPNKDERFYGDFIPLYDILNHTITPLYNMVRNYVSKKPYSIEKFKLNFGNPTFLYGWDVNKESDNSSIILRKDGLYYIAIMNKQHTKIFKNIKSCISADTPCYEKMEYKLLPGANKMLPKVFFSKSRIDEFKPSARLIEKYEQGTHKKGVNFSLKDCHDLIDFFKRSISIHPDWKEFNFQFSSTESYDDISGFYREVEQQGYKITFRNISQEYINTLIDEGKLYLFQLYNKDFSPNSKGTPNMHTLYWKMLFDTENLKNVVYKLNGQAEMFYRKASIKPEDQIVHPADTPIASKSEANIGRTSTFNYDIIKDKRFTVDQFKFHIPISLNFKARNVGNINTMVRQYIKEGGIKHIIGIDRGERNLIYITITDMKGNLVKQLQMNEITNHSEGVEYRTDYHKLLDAREKDNDKARKNWNTIKNIKEIKDGYLSQVVHKISQMIVEYNAIVVLEDLNFGFMRGRQKIEKQVYGKFEQMLIDKLHYLVDKKKSPTELGGLLNALQLTPAYDQVDKRDKQCGFVFFIPAWNTSKIDPVTGFVNLFNSDSTRYENIEKAKAFFNKFDSIKYNSTKEFYEFSFDYSNFTTRADGTRTKWTICTHGERIRTFRNPLANNMWSSEAIILTDKFNELFKKYEINSTDNLKDAIMSQSNKEFFTELLKLFKLTLQMRNSNSLTNEDYIISPVANAQGAFYDSRTCVETLPKDADANGAYNIARKGEMLIKRIMEAEDTTKLNLSISNKDWLSVAQK